MYNLNVTVDQARETLLSFDASTEGSHHGHPDFRVRNKIFATLWPQQQRAVLRLPLELAEGLAVSNPMSHKVLSRSGKWGWLGVALERIDDSEFADLASKAHAGIR